MAVCQLDWPEGRVLGTQFDHAGAGMKAFDSNFNVDGSHHNVTVLWLDRALDCQDVFVDYARAQSQRHPARSLYLALRMQEATGLSLREVRDILGDRRDQWYAEYQDAPVDVRHDRMRWIDDRSRPVMVAGERVEVHIPFEGESELFYTKATTFNMNPPCAVIHGNEVVLGYDTPADQPRDVRSLVDQTLRDIGQHLGWQREMIDAHNRSLPNATEHAIRQRRERLLAQSQRAEALGIPIRRRSDAPKNVFTILFSSEKMYGCEPRATQAT